MIMTKEKYPDCTYIQGNVDSPITTRVKTFEERKAGNHIVSCSEMDCDRPSTPTLSIVRCNFWGINNESTSVKFSLTELDDKSGFVVDMRDVTVIPSDYIFIESAPKWLAFLIQKFGKAE